MAVDTLRRLVYVGNTQVINDLFIGTVSAYRIGQTGALMPLGLFPRGAFPES
jgi:hypothetical protein